MSTTFEIWDRKTRNLIAEFDQLDQAIALLRDFVADNGRDATDGVTLMAVSEDGSTSVTLAEDAQLVNLVSSMPIAS